MNEYFDTIRMLKSPTGDQKTDPPGGRRQFLGGNGKQSNAELIDGFVLGIAWGL